MAVGGGDGSIVLTTSVDDSGLKKGLGTIKKIGATMGKAFLAVGAAATAATVAITKSAVSAYADYEQLVGGVETLFKGSAGKVLEYANMAFATTGQSANEYMQNVTSFSASLLSAVGGDTEKAAEVANAAMISISDNVNKMGSDAESVQMAFQGFAKGQYMLLDNLKLGYGGTKTEMERLLKDAQAITGVKYDINNLADVYTAIGVIQEKLGIAGTTAKEAESTISGSAAMMKAAWQNTLTAVAGGGDFDAAIENLVYSVGAYFKNIVPVIERALQGIGTLVEKVAPLLVQTVARSLIKAIPSLLAAVYQMVIGLAKGIYQGIADLFSGATQELAKKQTENISESVEEQNALTEAVEETEKAQKGALAGFDEINTLSKDTAEEQTTEDLVSVMPESGVSEVADDVASVSNNLQGVVGFLKNIKKALDPLITATQKWVKLLNFNGTITSLKSLLKPLSELGVMFQDALYYVYTEFLLPLSTWTINEAAPALVDTLNKGLEALSKITKPILDGSKELFEYIKPIFDWIGDTAIGLINDIGEVFSSVGDVFEEKSGLIREAFSKIGETVLVIWEERLKPQFDNIVGFFKGVFEELDKIVEDIIDIFVGVVDFIDAVFKGDWESAWNGVVDVFKGVVNLIIDAINALISGINKFKFDLPDWGILGDWAGKELGFNIPKIPRLAQGTVVPPNNEFMAILGDNKKETEIVSPLSTMKQAFIEAMMTVNAGQSQDNRPIVLQVDSREIARITRAGEEKLGTQTVYGGFANAY